MTIRSIRFRLTLWYTAAFVVGMGIVFALFYFITAKIFSIQADIILSQHCDQIVETLRRNFTTQIQLTTSPDMLLVIADANNNLISNNPLSEADTQQITELLSQSPLTSPLFIDRVLSTGQMRFKLATVYSRENQFLGSVLMGHSVEVIKQSLNRLLLILLLAFGLLLGPTILGGYLLARSAMAPMVEMSHQLRLIDSEHLDQRVRIPATRDELAELAATFNHLLDRLHNAFSRQRQFIGDVAHELKTPLATLKSQIEVALTQPRPSTQYRKTLQEMATDVEQLSRTLKDVLELAWAESENNSDQKVDLSQMARDLLEIIAKLSSLKKVGVQGDIQNGLVVSGQSTRLSRAVLNILDNALKYTKPGGKIYFLVHRQNNSVHLVIRDTGSGIASGDLPHVFERFYRGKDNRTAGTGLGLAIARAVILSHGGKIDISSQLNKGTTITVALPLFIKSS